jgi:hypothetical protein
MEHHGQALGVDQRPLGEDQGEQARGHGTGQQPARTRWRGRVVGMSDELTIPAPAAAMDSVMGRWLITQFDSA